MEKLRYGKCSQRENIDVKCLSIWIARGHKITLSSICQSSLTLLDRIGSTQLDSAEKNQNGKIVHGQSLLPLIQCVAVCISTPCVALDSMWQKSNSIYTGRVSPLYSLLHSLTELLSPRKFGKGNSCFFSLLHRTVLCTSDTITSNPIHPTYCCYDATSI